MNHLQYWFYHSKLWVFILRLRGRVPAGFFVGRSMSRTEAQDCVGMGWDLIVGALFDACLLSGTHIHQIKEKFGTLRFYVGYAPDWLNYAIEGAEIVSARTCEECGKAGKLRPGGWVKTLCDTCATPEARQRRREHNWQ